MEYSAWLRWAGETARVRDYGYETYGDESEGEEYDLDDDADSTVAYALQLAMQDKEELLVEKALAKIRRAHVLGKKNVRLSQEEIEALERKHRRAGGGRSEPRGAKETRKKRTSLLEETTRSDRRRSSREWQWEDPNPYANRSSNGRSPRSGPSPRDGPYGPMHPNDPYWYPRQRSFSGGDPYTGGHSRYWEPGAYDWYPEAPPHQTPGRVVSISSYKSSSEESEDNNDEKEQESPPPSANQTVRKRGETRASARRRRK
ncbi:hypothetical protein VTN31DRAFT_6813 [Thermomyces dupontii]|uniref:uncharacterized protein n=1 Tax=Talaromyces thermophilus TaxID=28565 RepID=UPI0037426314